jgi:hypothetical protein
VPEIVKTKYFYKQGKNMKKVNSGSFIQNVQTQEKLMLSVTTLLKAWDLAQSTGWQDPALEPVPDDRADERDQDFVHYSPLQAQTLARALELGLLDIQAIQRIDSRSKSPQMYSGGYDDVSSRRYFAGKRKLELMRMIGFLRQGACLVVMSDVLVSKSQGAEGLVMPKSRIEDLTGADEIYTDYSEACSKNDGVWKGHLKVKKICCKVYQDNKPLRK